MPCVRIDMGNGSFAIACMRGRRRPKPCIVCRAVSTRLCDGMLPKPHGGTRVCSAPLCADHAVRLGAGSDYCPSCAAARGLGDEPPCLIVYTARIGYAGTDGLDISRKSGKGDGLAFAPSWSVIGARRGALRGVLRPAIDARAVGDAGVEAAAWAAYVPAFTAEMRVSWKRERAAWDRLLARAEVTLLCYCTNPERCHRTLLARDILPRVGATYGGERQPRPVGRS